MSTLGSHGDVHPFLAIGRELRARGHEAVLITNPYFEPHARDAGVPLEPFGEAVSIKDLLDRHANSMHALQGPKVVIRDMLLPLVP